MTLTYPIHRLKFYLAAKLKNNPSRFMKLWELLRRFPFALPHDRAFFAFKFIPLPEKGLFLDVGANNGMSALSFRHINKNLDIFSIEVDPVHELNLNNLRNQMKGFDYKIIGAGDTEAELHFFRPFHKKRPIHLLSSLDKQYLIAELERVFSHEYIKEIEIQEKLVKVIPLDTLGFSPSVIKIDAEGYDLKVLKGLVGTVNRCRPVLMYELGRTDYLEMNELISSLNYNTYFYDHTKEVFRPIDLKSLVSRLEKDKLAINPFCFPSERKLEEKIPLVK